MAAPLKLYVKLWCPWCISAMEYLDQHGYPYEKLDVLADPETYSEMIRISGQRYTPTLVVGDKVLPDFGPEELARFLARNGLAP